MAWDILRVEIYSTANKLEYILIILETYEIFKNI